MRIWMREKVKSRKAGGGGDVRQKRDARTGEERLNLGWAPRFPPLFSVTSPVRFIIHVHVAYTVSCIRGLPRFMNFLAGMRLHNGYITKLFAKQMTLNICITNTISHKMHVIAQIISIN
jgi:hypothetical protein